MHKDLLFELPSGYRDHMKIHGYHFGGEEKTACVVGAMRGNEVQQLYVCSQLVKALKELEGKGRIAKGKGILVIPCCNSASMNIGRRFWAMDNTDINRMFPGYDQGETTQRIAAGVFEAVKDYTYGLQLASFYMPGDFIPHVRLMDTGYQNTGLANLFGLPYVVVRKPRPYDTTTLNYNWQIWNTNAFSVYTKETASIDEDSARQAVQAILRFLTRMGILRMSIHGGYIATTIKEEDMRAIHAGCAGIYRRCGRPGDAVAAGQVLGEIIDPCEGQVLQEIKAPCSGVLFFAQQDPLVMEKAILFKMIAS